jgi:hypothetical protein
MAEDYVRCYRNLVENRRPARGSDSFVRNGAVGAGLGVANAGARRAAESSNVGLSAVTVNVDAPDTPFSFSNESVSEEPG